MGVLDNELNWRRVFQDVAADLKCTTTPDGTTEQPVKQATAASLKCTNTPDGTTAQPVSQVSGVSGIWPPANAARINEQGLKAGVGSTIIYTVPGSKKLFISGSCLASVMAVDVASEVFIGVRDGSDVWQFYVLLLKYVVKGQQVSSGQNMPALEAAAGWDVYVDNDHAGLLSRGVFFGWLEDA